MEIGNPGIKPDALSSLLLSEEAFLEQSKALSSEIKFLIEWVEAVHEPVLN